MSFLLNFLFKTLKSNTLCSKDEFKNNKKAKEKDYYAINYLLLTKILIYFPNLL